jgi:predicted amidohydrolase
VQVQVRAYENCLAVAVANQADSYGGRSLVAGHDGHIVAEAGVSEQILMADLDLRVLRDARAKCLWTERFRAPEAYKAIASGGN